MLNSIGECFSRSKKTIRLNVERVYNIRASAQDAVWVNGGTAACHTAGDVCLMLKASDKVIYTHDTVSHTYSVSS